LAEDSARFTLTTGATLDIQPASGEFDTVSMLDDDAGDTGRIIFKYFDGINISVDDMHTLAGFVDRSFVSTNLIFTRFENIVAGTEIAMRVIMTLS